jgi:hypothetical protein
MIQIQDILEETEIDFLLYDQLVYDIDEIEEKDITIKEFIKDINKVLSVDNNLLETDINNLLDTGINKVLSTDNNLLDTDINKVLLQDKKYLYIRVLDCLYGIKYNQNMECALNVFFEFGKLSELYQKANTK